LYKYIRYCTNLKFFDYANTLMIASPEQTGKP
jgi:hypothetical protein